MAVDLTLFEEAWEQQTPGEKKLLGTLCDTPWWPPLRKVIVRMQSQAVEQMAPLGTPPEVIAAAQGKLSLARELLDLLEDQAPAAYDKAQQAEREAS